MDKINVKIDGLSYSVSPNQSVLEACHEAGIDIPTLCYLKGCNEIGACRICLVDVVGQRAPVASCVFPVGDGMEIITNSPRIRSARKTNLELLLSNHNKSCLSCSKSTTCELQKLCRDYGVEDLVKYNGAMTPADIDESAPHMVRDNSKCILCRRCVAVCKKWQGVGVIGPNERGFKSHIGSAFEADLADTTCVSCGQCIVACPTGALMEKDDTPKVWDALADESKYVVVQAAPSIRATLGECFGMPVGTNVEGKMVAALRRLGFKAVFDTDFAADLTIMEEATEFLDRLNNGGKLPLITSCSPGWIKFCETFHPEFIENLSSCKSPQQMFGAIAKTWYAEKVGVKAEDMVVVSIMPCTAKKFEIGRADQSAAGVPDVDIALTCREVGRMIEKAGINFTELPDEEFDSPMGTGSGAGHIFGATGGVMEAALRTAYEVVTGKELAKVEFDSVRGTESIKEATIKVGDLDIKVCVTSGLANADKVLREINEGKRNYHFIEIMACPGGCVNGGGQPTQPASVRNFTDLKALRAKALYDEDKGMKLRKSHENPDIKQLYDEFLEKPGSHKAHKLLHTTYVKREKQF